VRCDVLEISKQQDYVTGIQEERKTCTKAMYGAKEQEFETRVPDEMLVSLLTLYLFEENVHVTLSNFLS